MVPALEPTCWHPYPQDVKILNGKGEGFLKFVESSNANKHSLRNPQIYKSSIKKSPFRRAMNPQICIFLTCYQTQPNLQQIPCLSCKPMNYTQMEPTKAPTLIAVQSSHRWSWAQTAFGSAFAPSKSSSGPQWEPLSTFYQCLGSCAVIHHHT